MKHLIPTYAMTTINVTNAGKHSKYIIIGNSILYKKYYTVLKCLRLILLQLSPPFLDIMYLPDLLSASI